MGCAVLVVVVVRRILLAVCLEDGLEGWSWWGCVVEVRREGTLLDDWP